jgi:vitamin K-dependent gamma-carboxylase
VYVFKKILAKVEHQAFAPVDIASLVFFRIAFGLLMAWDVSRYFTLHRIAPYWLEPQFLFKYYGFSWVHPWPGNGLYVHLVVLGLLALAIAAGFFYRVSTVLFFLGYTYIFLLDEAQWLNHTYLFCLFGFLLIFVPANRAFSIDVWRNVQLRSATTPQWTLWLLRAQMAFVYFFAGVAKISSDWIHGEPMRVWLYPNRTMPMIGRFFEKDWFVYSLSYAALLFDLCIVPFLFWRRTRAAAFCLALIFHVLNMQLFPPIGLFPWVAIAGTTIFLSSSWPRCILSSFRRRTPPPSRVAATTPLPTKRRVVLLLVTLYIAIQIFLPLRHFLSRGGVEWIHAEHRFSWRMMLLRQAVRSYFYVTDPNSGRTFAVTPKAYLKGWQVEKMGWRPDMVLQFAHYLAKVMPRSGPQPLRVEARVLVSINGRKPQLIIDPTVDLASERRTLGRPRWLLEIREPLPDRSFTPPIDPD